ncbi:TPA: hypothetical protein PEB60_002068 [Staphylococcus aureus]|nr:hypothetical protein [Staphylococcus haemolyticus]MBB2519547.1 hypothetical protein [Staphylococcus aureus]MBF2137775.1 hypothetical protein [Staphylococcus epidermidis]MBN4892411.1 hypothetical protein [Staphylococcus sp. EG-SA-18]MBN4900703.1 hypothetical protein [Staphylococcus sp. EG-SA-19]MBN4930298.1 hypothetical protein [Staphylococcus sp. EG-SA-8]MBN4952049.1 hypothetical protein [Staphylococcus sp. EG-SA-2]MCC2089982.1 hypothetical protein [Mammaliicoccus sciuri]
MNDLKAYQREGGVYYFVVYLIVENKKVVEKQVYGKQLHQLDLQFLLQKKQKSVTIKMYEIENEKILYNNCVKYINEKRLQNQVGQVKVKNIEKALSYIATPENIVMDHRGLPLNDFYGYIKINSSELDVTIPDGVLSMEKVKRVNKKQIIKEGKLLFEGMVGIETSKESISITIDDIFKIQTFESDNKSTYTMLPFKKLNIAEQSFNVINELSKGGEFFLDQIQLVIQPFEINIIEIKETINKLNIKLSEYSNLLSFDVSLKSTEFDKQMNEIKGLLELLEYKNFKDFKMHNNGYYKMKFCGKFILLFKDNTSLYNVYSNDFVDRFEAVTKERVVQMPIVYTLTRDMIVDVLNFDINVIKECIESDKIAIQSDIKWEKLNNFALELIAAYDETQRTDLLELAEYVLNNLLNFDNDKIFMNLINKAQIIKRRRNDVDEKLLIKLFKLRDKLIDIDKEIATLYINVVSGSKQEAKIRYETLNAADLEIFNAYPIFNLYKKLIES